MGTRASTEAEAELHELSDPAFFTYWSLIRVRLVLTPRDSPEHAAARARYDAVAAEFRRRLDSAPRGLAS